jgi:hypothetical protein
MSDGAQKSPGYRAVDVVAWREMRSVLSGLLHSTVSVIEMTGQRWTTGQLVEHVDDVAAAAPPHYEFAIAEAARAWARGDRSALSALPGRNPLGAVHVTAVFVAALGPALWGGAGFLGVLTAYGDTVAAIAGRRSAHFSYRQDDL